MLNVASSVLAAESKSPWSWPSNIVERFLFLDYCSSFKKCEQPSPWRPGQSRIDKLFHLSPQIKIQLCEVLLNSVAYSVKTNNYRSPTQYRLNKYFQSFEKIIHWIKNTFVLLVNRCWQIITNIHCCLIY